MSPVMTSMRRLVVLLLVVVGASLVTATSAQAACPCRQVSVPDTTKGAQVVFAGTITDAVRAPGGTPVVFDYEVTVERVYRGSITTETVQVVTEPSFATCARPRPAEGQPYLFSLTTTDGQLVASACNDVMLADATVVRQVERLLGEGREPVSPEPPEVALEPAGASDPETLTRTAAPGAALVIVGLLGLLVVRRVGRARR